MGYPFASAAAILQIAQPEIAPEIAYQIAGDILQKCAHDQARILTALNIFENHQMENPSGIVFLERLLNEELMSRVV